MIIADTITAPAYWASYLVNGDASGLDAEEKQAADAWQKEIAPWRVVSTATDGGTTQCGDVLDYIVHKSN